MKLVFEIDGVLSDACILDTCCVTIDPIEKVICFVVNADTLTMRFAEKEGNVEANDSFRRQFTPSCNFQNVV